MATAAETLVCICGNTCVVQVASGYNKPESKGKKYISCPACKEFTWVTTDGEKAVVAPTIPVKQPEVKEVVREPLPPIASFIPRNYDAENRGKCRHGLLVARTQLVGLVPMTQDEFDALTQLVEISMTGKIPTSSEDIEDIDLPSEFLNDPPIPTEEED